MTHNILPWNEIERLAALQSCQVPNTGYAPAFDKLVRVAARLTGCSSELVPISDESRQWLFASSHFNRFSSDPAFLALARMGPLRPLIVPDVEADARFAGSPLVGGPSGIRFYAGIPLLNPQGQASAMLCLVDYVPRQLDPQDVETLAQLGQAIMTTVELRGLLEQTHVIAHRAIERFARVIEAMPAAVVLSGAADRIRLINPCAERLFGYDRAELEGKPVELLLPQRFRARHVGLRQNFLKNMSPRSIGGGELLFGLRKDGSEFAVEIDLSPMHIDGEPMALTVIVDIGPRHIVEQERERERCELQRSNADLQEFAYAASHDLKAPLRAISHLAEWIHADVAATASQGTLVSLNLLQGRVSRLQVLLDGLLAYARVEHAAHDAEDVDVEAMVHDITALLDPPRGFSVVCRGPWPVIRTQRIPFELVMTNLIGNAVKHHDRTEGRVSVCMRSLHEAVEIRVSDDGPGIPKRFQTRIFEIFQTLKSRDDTESSGIGLAIVKKRVQRNGGQISVESDPPARGTTFVVIWKIIPAS